ncbi:MAG: PEP/pyruvate-binding domain-containing protein [Candidatus Ozemobacteraceae bacterium]
MPTKENFASSKTPGPGESINHPPLPSVVGERLSLEAFHQLAGVLAGCLYVKVVVDRKNGQIHFVNNASYQFHSDYIAVEILHEDLDHLLARITEFNQSVYADPERRFYLGIVALHGKEFFTLETVEVDTMDAEMLIFFYNYVENHLDPAFPLIFKPANHLQETFIVEIDPVDIPRIYSHQLFATSNYFALNKGEKQGRLRMFRNDAEYRKNVKTIAWFDILCMDRVPDDIPRVSGIINAEHTTPLSHTNVLANGWHIPNAIQIGAMDLIEKEQLNGQWVEYRVDVDAPGIHLQKIEKPADFPQQPSWNAQPIKLEEPDILNNPIESLSQLRLSDRSRYGTKAAHLGELHRILQNGSERLLGFYQIPRPPRDNLLPYLSQLLGVARDVDLARASLELLKERIHIPRGIAIPFSIQQKFLQTAPRIQQQIGKLKMALELDARNIEQLCLELQQMIRSQRVSDKIRDYIDSQIIKHLGGVSNFVIRSSSNAEDLENFSAAGIYESINHVTTADKIFESIREVWASLVSPRSVRLRQEVGISLDDCYMGVIIQEEAKSDIGGVLVTKNPAAGEDFRNVYINVSTRSVISVVQGSDLPYQFLYNTVEGGGRTISLGSATEDLSNERKDALQKLALVGRLLQSHYSQDYTFSRPLDIEWVMSGKTLYILQIRPYAG